MSIGGSCLSSIDGPVIGSADSTDGWKVPSTESNLLTVDFEDWRQSTLDHDLPISGRVLDNTRRLLDIVDTASARGTFFFLGQVAKRYSQFVLAAQDPEAGRAALRHPHGNASARSPGFLEQHQDPHRATRPGENPC